MCVAPSHIPGCHEQPQNPLGRACLHLAPVGPSQGHFLCSVRLDQLKLEVCTSVPGFKDLDSSSSGPTFNPKRTQNFRKG